MAATLKRSLPCSFLFVFSNSQTGLTRWPRVHHLKQSTKTTKTTKTTNISLTHQKGKNQINQSHLSQHEIEPPQSCIDLLSIQRRMLLKFAVQHSNKFAAKKVSVRSLARLLLLVCLVLLAVIC